MRHLTLDSFAWLNGRKPIGTKSAARRFHAPLLPWGPFACLRTVSVWIGARPAHPPKWAGSDLRSMTPAQVFFTTDRSEERANRPASGDSEWTTCRALVRRDGQQA
jgi:hypothetical protein